MRRRAQRRGEQGFALLLVFAMAAAVVVMLYLEAPRLATESLRSKEQLLIDRGEQYQRAIQIFVRTIKKYPQSLEELEKFQDKRFLRRRYKDPFTGEEEWRLIHSDANGILYDSKVYGPKKDADGKEPRQTFVGELPSIGNPNPVDPNDPNAQNPALQRRASDRPAIASGQGAGGAPQPDPNAPLDPNAPPIPNQLPGQPGAFPGGFPGLPTTPGQPGAPPVIPGAPGISGMPSFRPANPIVNPGTTGTTGATGTTGSSGGGFIGGSIPSPGGVSSSQGGGFIGAPIGGSAATSPTGARPGGTAQGAVGGVPGVPGGLPSGAPGQVPTAAADLIRQILTTPRAGGLQGAQGMAQGGLGAGIAGIASKKEATGIKIYNERTRYDEWEFVYDQSKEAKSAMAAAGVNSQGTNQPGGPLQGSQPGTSGAFGNPGATGAFGNPGSSGASGRGFSQPASPTTGSSGSTGGGFIGGPIPTTKK